ncbi:MAG: restriction endonuclease subunit S [Niveispirillum sp.]|nr:restriction endonuclease subunit S [Niveispirillum sp.]
MSQDNTLPAAEWITHLDIPNSWCWVTLGQIADIKGGLAKGKKRRPDQPTRLVPYLRVANVQRGYLDLSEIKYIDATDDEFGELLLFRGDILFNEGGDRDKLGRGWIWNDEIAGCIHQNHVFRARPASPELISKLISMYGNIYGQAYFIGEGKQTTNLASVSLSKLASLPVPLIPANEQNRIVTKIDSLFARSSRARDELAHIPKLVERYRQAVLEAAFRGDLTADWRASNPTLGGGIQAEADKDGPYELPASWQWIRLPRLGLLGRGKSRHRPRNDPSLFGGPYPFIQTGEVRAADGFLNTFTKTYSEKGLAQSKVWPVGTVCITIAANIAETAVLGIEACFPDSVVGFVANSRLTIPEYIEFFIRTVRSDLEAFAPATAQKNINLDTLEEVLVPLPPVEEQQAIVDRIISAFHGLSRMNIEHDKATSLIDRLDASILDKAFSGQLVPQDPNDEPASKLLKRIRAARAAAPAVKRGRKAKGAADGGLF